ncbi:MAG: methionine ABC transporter permease [Bulleidia sp.]
MPEPFATWFPNVANYWDIFLQALSATFQMFLIAGILTLLIGGVAGIALTVTGKDGISPNRVIHFLLEAVTNIFRAVPFIILLIFLIPFTRAIAGTSIGVKGAIVPLVFGAVPFYTRQVETALAEVDTGKIEAARAMGSGNIGIIFRVYLHEAVPDLFRVTTITAISMIGLTTSAGAVGAGGIGSFAINYGQNLHYQDVVNLCVILLLVIVSCLQLIGNTLSHATKNRKLIHK